MSITFTGNNVFRPVSGEPIFIGDTAAGSLTINGGSVGTLDGNSVGDQVFVTLGNTATGDGSVLVAGAGSTLNLLGDASTGLAVTGMNVGSEGSGSLTVRNGGTMNIVNSGSGSPNAANFTIGRNGGMGEALIDNGTVHLSSEDSYFYVGRNGSTADMIVQNGSMIDIDGSVYAGFQVGRSGGDGLLVINNSSMTLDSTDSYAQIGRDGGQGELRITNNAMVRFTGTDYSTLTIGRDGGTGEVNIDNATVEIESTSGEAGSSIGRGTGGSTGDLDISNGSTVDFRSSGLGSYINIGRDVGAIARATVTDSMLGFTGTGANAYAIVNVGRDGSTGTFTINNSAVNVDSAQSLAAVRVGFEASTGDPGADGLLEVKGGSTLNIEGETAVLRVGYSASASGTLQVLQGSVVTITDTVGANDQSDFKVGANNGAMEASALISGAGSSIEGMALTEIGFNTFSNGPGLGKGMLTVQNNGRLESGDIVIGAGGTLVGGDSTFDLNTANGSGIMSFHEGSGIFSAGTVTQVNGDLDFTSATFTVDVNAGGTASGLLRQNGTTFTNDGNSGLTINPLGNYKFSAGDQFRVFETNATTYDNLLTGPGGFTANGQSANFSFAFIETLGMTKSLDFVALTNGNGSGSAILDLGATGDGTTFDYLHGTGEGFGTSASRNFSAVNLDGVLGTDDSDNLSVTGPAGFTFDGRGGNDTIVGSSGAEIISGSDGADRLIGRGQTDILDGGDGNDVLLGGGGNDVLIGGLGADFMRGDNGIDRATFANASAGVTVDFAVISNNTGEAAGDKYFLIENLDGSDFNDDLRGDAENNYIKGRDGNDFLRGRGGDDTLEGGRGADQLLGQGGADTFLFTGPNQGIDTVLDFDIGTDTLAFTGANFGGLSAGPLAAGQFHVGAAAADANDFFVYNAANGRLFYDADGSGAGAAKLMAVLAGTPLISASDIEIV